MNHQAQLAPLPTESPDFDWDLVDDDPVEEEEEIDLTDILDPWETPLGAPSSIQSFSEPC